jgi:hypothetical protein
LTRNEGELRKRRIHETEESEHELIPVRRRSPQSAEKPVSRYRKTWDQDDSDSDVRSERRVWLSPRTLPGKFTRDDATRQRRLNVRKREEKLCEDVSDDAIDFERTTEKSAAIRNQRKSAEEEADEILRAPRPGSANRVMNFSHVNELVDLANHLRDDYYKLGRYLGQDQSTEDMSIEHLSRLNESLVSGQRASDDLSE